MNFYNSGYGYERSDEGYTISHGQIPSKRSNGYVDVWSAYDWLPPEGQRLMNGDSEFFNSRLDAIKACEEHLTNKEKKDVA
jgi:hypothetical protein